MKKLLFILIPFIIVICFGSPAQTTFQKSIGTVENDRSYCLQQTNDGGYIAAGETVEPGLNFTFDIYLIRLNQNGDTLWTRSIGAIAVNENANSVHQNNDNGFIVCGESDNGSFLVRTDASGNIVWSKTYSGLDLVDAEEAHQTIDGGFVVVGNTGNLGDPTQIFLLKTNANGLISWQKIFHSGIAIYDAGYSVQQTSDSGYVITGSSTDVGVSNSMSLIKTDVNGIVLWAKLFTGYNIGYSVQQTSDGGYIIAGTNYITNYDTYLIRTNSIGDTLWTRAYGSQDQDYAYSVRLTNDNGFVVAGTTRILGLGAIDAYAFKTDSTGNLVWSKAFGGTSNDYAYSAQQTTDGGYVIAGATYSFSSGQSDVFVIKTDTTGSSGCNEMNYPTLVSVPPITLGTATFTVTSGLTVTSAGFIGASDGDAVLTHCSVVGINETISDNSLFIYPNPSNGNFKIGMSGDINIGTVEILNLHGEKIYSEKINNSAEITIRTNHLSPGMYFVTVVKGENKYTRKLIIQN